jgi:hypothetical protein
VKRKKKNLERTKKKSRKGNVLGKKGMWKNRITEKIQLNQNPK